MAVEMDQARFLFRLLQCPFGIRQVVLGSLQFLFEEEPSLEVFCAGQVLIQDLELD
jgi:hypothetical protein